MSTIRPFITLTIIVIVGVFLFRKINEGPAHVPHGGTETFQRSTVDSAPPLATTPSTTASDSHAPAWGSSTPSTEPPAPKWADSVAENSAGDVPTGTPLPQGQPVGNEELASADATTTPEAPPIPALPPLAEVTPPAEMTAPATAPAQLDPPTSIPVARYESDERQVGTPTPPTATPFNSSAGTAPAAPATEVVSPVDRYAQGDATAVEPALAPPAASPLAANWSTIQSALERQELAQAHAMLSQIYGNPALTPIEARQVETLLSQLAGTVVYSTEHRLEPPYIVHAGDTLETIAKQYEVPWQLLAKINGIPAADLVQPGQELKVIHGPFSAVVELSKGQMTLMLGERYAGRFPIIAEPAATEAEGQWTLEQKLVNPPSSPEGVVSASYDATTPVVDRVLVLRSDSSQVASTVISITSGTSTPTGPVAVAPAAIRVSPQDAEELADILSVGSRVTIRK